MDRVIPLIRALRPLVDIPISVDTSKPQVAEKALAAGANWINDVTGFQNPDMIAIAAAQRVPIVMMHMQGTPQTMQNSPHYSQGIIPHLIEWFSNRVERLLLQGIEQENIILDPGIGFGKTVADNLIIIHNLQKFKQLGFRILLGISRKSFMGKILNESPQNLLSATIAMNSIAIMSETDIIRVHDVKEHRAAIDMLAALKGIQ